MLIHVLKSKIVYASVTGTHLYYEGSITIDETIMQRAHIVPNERVQVVNLNNGERLETYVITGEPNTGVIALNGPAARKCALGDQLFILSYVLIDPDKETHQPIKVDYRQEIAV